MDCAAPVEMEVAKKLLRSPIEELFRLHIWLPSSTL